MNIYEKYLAAARIDVFATQDGLKIVESNTEIPGGNEESQFLEQEHLRIFQPEGLTAAQRMEVVYKTLLHFYEIQAEHFGLPPRGGGAST